MSRLVLPLAATAFLTLFHPGGAHSAEVITVAVASNALPAIEEVAAAYEAEHTAEIRLVSGSTGRLYTQITQGAPFDVFLAADELRPRLLEEKGLTRAGTRFTYARGVLAAWSDREGLIPAEGGLDFLREPATRRITIANPDTAPYGRAAVEALKELGLYEEVTDKLVYGENVSQAFGFARTGNADAAIVALSTVRGRGGSVLLVEGSLYSPITQDGVVTKDAPEGAERFTDFIRNSTKATEIFNKYGYLAVRP